MIGWSRPVSFVNARVVTGGSIASRIRFRTSVLAFDEEPRPSDVVVDLNGAFVLPGLVNAHDHLELNHYGLLTRRDHYANAIDWIEDLTPLLASDDDVRRNSAFPLGARLLIGGLKNLLAGVTTVAHHNPRYAEIGRWFPVRLVKKFGWAHSFHLEGRPVGANGERGSSVREACLATPLDRPFIVHLGEGVDGRAADEFRRLEAFGGFRANTLLVHGVAITPEIWQRAVAVGTSLVWCPASNIFLFGRTLDARRLLDATPGGTARLSIGTDSRITGSRDLLDELRAARAASPLTASELFRAVTEAPARALKLPRAGALQVGSPADLVVLPALADDPGEALLAARRSDLTLVVLNGRPALGADTFEEVFVARQTATLPITVDGIDRLADARLAKAIARSPIREPGVECR